MHQEPNSRYPTSVPKLESKNSVPPPTTASSLLSPSIGPGAGLMKQSGPAKKPIGTGQIAKPLAGMIDEKIKAQMKQ